MDYWLYWLIAAIILLIVEIATLWLSALCFAVGCLAALMSSLLGSSLTTQLIILAFTALMIFIIFGKKWIMLQQRRANKKNLATNIDALNMREAIVVETIPENGIGRIKVDGDIWQAHSTDGSPIEVNARVKITGHESIIMTVKRI
jgi:membrane protein implicated in regulation of membrane protease activity